MAVAAACVAVSVPASALAAGVDLPGVGNVEVPDAGDVVPDVPDLPDVPGLPETPDVDPIVDDVVDQVPAVDDVLPGGGNDPAPANPADPTTPPADPPSGGDAGTSGGDVAEAPADAPGAGGGGGDGGNGNGNGNGDGDGGGGTDAGGPQAAGAAAAAGGAGGEADGGNAAAEEDPDLSTRIGDLIAALPIGILIGLVGLAVIALLMTGRSAWFARASRRLTLQRFSLQQDVGALQAALVPDLPEAIGGVGVAVAYRPAAGPAAGGDFHDVFELADGKIGIVVGDVAGHGREALPRTGVVRYTIRAYLEAGLEPRVAIRLADRALGGSFDGDFASAVAATYDPATRRLVYSCAGHPQPLVIGGDPRSEVDVLAAPPIGIGHASGSRQTTLALDPGCELWIFTDGLIEAHAEGEMLGRDGLRELLGGRPEPADLLNDLPGEDRDDLTVVRLLPPESDDPPQPFSVETLLVEHSYDEIEILRFLEAAGVGGGDLDAVCDRVAAERKLEGHVLIRISRIEDAMHWRVERVESHLGRTAPAVEGAPASPLAG